jgi:probable HAF family extracellular repeat protein
MRSLSNGSAISRTGLRLSLRGWTVAALAAVQILPAAAQQPVGRYDVVEYARLENPGTISVVRHISDGNEVAGGFKGADPRKLSQAFLLTARGPIDVSAGVATDNAVAYGVNQAGETAGAFNVGSALRPFRSVRQSAFRELPLLPRDSAGAAYAINENGEAAGYSSGSEGARAVTWTRGGAVQPLPSPAGVVTRAFDINPRGDVVGVAGGQVSRGALWPGKGSMVALRPIAGFTGSEAVSISESGDIVGHSIGVGGASDRSRAVLWRARTTDPVDLGTLQGGDYSRARDVNVRGEVVGVSTSSRGEHAFIWTAATGMVDLNSLVSLPNLALVDAVSINRNGFILAIAQEAHGDGAGDHDHGDHEVPQRIVVLVPAP